MQLVLPSNSVLRRFSGRFRSPGGRRVLTVRSALGFSARCETIIRCLQGRVWITDGGAGDVILSAGGKFTGGKGSRIVIEALDESLVEIHG